MSNEITVDSGRSIELVEGLPGIVSDWSSDQRAFKRVPWGKAMMWIFLLSDTFIFSCFLISYMKVRMTTTVPWPNPSEVFALTIAGNHIPLVLIAIMTFILISSSGNSANVVNAAKRAKVLNIGVITFSGFEHDNSLHKLGDINFWVDSKAYNIVEMTHHIWLLAIVDYIIGDIKYSAS